MTGPELTKLHMLDTRQTLTSEYGINQILEKEVELLTSTRQVKGGPIERKLFGSDTDDICQGGALVLHELNLLMKFHVLCGLPLLASKLSEK